MNCIIVDDNEIARSILEKFVNETDFLELIASCADGKEASNVMLNNPVDLAFLDIEMPEITGLELIKTLQNKPLIVFITSKKEYAIEAFEQDVVDYIVKPITYERFIKAVTKAKEIYTHRNSDVEDKDHLFIKVKGGFLQKLKFDEMVFIQAQSEYIKIVTIDNSFLVYASMNDFEKSVSKKEFARVHRSYIVRLDNIDGFEDNSIVLNHKQQQNVYGSKSSKQIIPISGSYKDSLMKQLNILKK